MARPYRLQGKNFFYHITDRGDDRKKIYISEYDRTKFLEYVLAAKERFKFNLYAYALMPNHYHLLIQTPLANISRIMQYINTSYTTYYNIKRGRVGHLFQGRYKSILVDKDSYFLELTRYVHLNPVRAGLVEDPIQYKWSSYKGYLDKRGDGVIDKDQINKILDMDAAQYKEFVLDGIENQNDPFKDVYAGFLLGSTTFIKDKLSALKEQVEVENFSYKKQATRNIEKEDIFEAVARAYKIDATALHNKRKHRSKEKKVAVYLMKRFTCLTSKEIGEIFNIGDSAVSKAAADVERSVKEKKQLRKEVERVISYFKA